MGKAIGLHLEDTAENHRAADVAEEPWFRSTQVPENPKSEAFERKDLEPREAAEPVFRQQLALELEGRLFGREEEQGWPVRILAERGPDPGEATPSLAASGRAEEESCAHEPGVADAGAGRETKSGFVPGIPARDGFV